MQIAGEERRKRQRRGEWADGAVSGGGSARVQKTASQPEARQRGPTGAAACTELFARRYRRPPSSSQQTALRHRQTQTDREREDFHKFEVDSKQVEKKTSQFGKWRRKGRKRRREKGGRGGGKRSQRDVVRPQQGARRRGRRRPPPPPPHSSFYFSTEELHHTSRSTGRDAT